MIAHTMSVSKNLFKSTFIVIFISVILITGCSSVQTSTLKTGSDYKKVWNACLDSLADIRFSASSTDSSSGLIIADQAVVGGKGTVSRLNIRISSESGRTIVAVKYVPPPGTIGGGGTVDRFVAALKQRIPDIEPVIVTSTGKSEKDTKQEINEKNNAPAPRGQQESVKEMTPKSSPQTVTNEVVPVSYLIVAKKTNIRATASARSRIITTAAIGDKVEKIGGASNKWFQVKTAQGKSGWILKSAVKQAE